jgi:hypothetical protein
VAGGADNSAFVVTEGNGIWAQAHAINTYPLTTGPLGEADPHAEVDFLSCWGQAELVPRIVGLDRDGKSQLTALACGSADHGAATGWYQHDHKMYNFSFATTER